MYPQTYPHFKVSMNFPKSHGKQLHPNTNGPESQSCETLFVGFAHKPIDTNMCLGGVPLSFKTFSQLSPLILVWLITEKAFLKNKMVSMVPFHVSNPPLRPDNLSYLNKIFESERIITHPKILDELFPVPLLNHFKTFSNNLPSDEQKILSITEVYSITKHAEDSDFYYLGYNPKNQFIFLTTLVAKLKLILFPY